MNSAFWQGKRVLVTGHTGFKGGWLCLWLQSMGARVVGYSLAPPSNPNLFQAARVGTGMTSIIGDILDSTMLQSAMAEHAPEIVFHLAAQALVRRSYADPAQTYATNVMGTVNVLEAVRQSGSVKVMVNVTSDKCYENREWPWGYRESDPMGGYDPYSSSKGCAELVTAAYRNSFFNPARFGEHGVVLASARAGNVIGGGDWAEDRLIPDIIRAIGRGEAARIRYPNAIRPWQHVLEPLSGYLLLAQKLWSQGTPYAEGWNFGPGDDDARPVAWVVDKLVEQWGEGASWSLAEGAQPHEANYLKLDCSKARSALGWKPRWDLATALQNVAAWYKSYLAGADVREVSMQQIMAYAADGVGSTGN